MLTEKEIDETIIRIARLIKPGIKLDIFSLNLIKHTLKNETVSFDGDLEIQESAILVKQIFIPDYPDTYYRLPSGTPGKDILVSEDPYVGIEARLVDKRE